MTTAKPVTFYRPNWQMWRRTPVAKLWEAVALSCDLEPECLIQYFPVGTPPDEKSGDQRFNPEFCPAEVIEFQHLLEIAKRNVWKGGKLRVEESSSKELNSKVRLSDFAEFARSIGRALPADYPRKEEGSSGERIVYQQKTPLQEEAILQELKTLGFDAKTLPKRGVKPDVSRRLRKSNKNLFQSTKVFDKAWDRLRGAGKISNS
jgi:hypothetical protein